MSADTVSEIQHETVAALLDQSPTDKSGARLRDPGSWRRFFFQASVLTTLMVAMFAGLLMLNDKASRYIPFIWEKNLSDFISSIYELPFKGGTDEVSLAWTKDLQVLIDNLALQMDMPEDIKIHVNYSPADSINAVAVMGGEVYVFDGLINLARSENALAFVLAHEIAHLKHRHGLRGVGRGSIISSAILMLFGTSGNLSEVANTANALSGLKYSRAMETKADEEAIVALARYYGHVKGAGQIFEDLGRGQKDAKGSPEVLLDHPNLSTRLARMKHLAMTRGFALEGELTPMALSMSASRSEQKCTKSATLCRIESSLERIRETRTSLVSE